MEERGTYNDDNYLKIHTINLQNLPRYVVDAQRSSTSFVYLKNRISNNCNYAQLNKNKWNKEVNIPALLRNCDLLKDKLTDRPGNFNNKMIDYNILYKIFRYS